MTPHEEGFLVGLITKIRVSHHVATRNLLEDLRRAVDRLVARANPTERATVLVLRGAFTTFQDDLLAHLLHEERVVFPYVLGLEQALESERPAPTSSFGPLDHPLAALKDEQASTRGALDRLEAAIALGRTHGGDPLVWDGLGEPLATLKRDLEVHVCLEQEVLFPAALDAEQRLAARHVREAERRAPSRT